MKVAFGITFTSATPLLRKEDSQQFMDLVKMRFGLEGKHVPEDMEAKIQAYVDSYVLYDHVRHEGQNPKQMDALGLTPYAMERFALAGNARDWIARIEQIASAGARKIWVGVSGNGLDNQKRYLKILGGEIMARFVA
jgi:hypothetical protein